MTLEKGALLHNRYLIEETIAVGGMGAVYRALDETLGIQVALKENFFSTEEYSRQFRREATILAGLRHPNLPRVTDHFVIPAQGQYLVMDFIEGKDLREIIAQDGSLSEVEVIQIGAVICDALAYLHSRNPSIVHRDIKPGNLKITTARNIFLVDFGLAKISHGEATTTGAQALTPGYAPPEQYGQGTEPRSDIYALGATLYAALTGKIPEDALSRAMGSAELTSVRKHNPLVTERLAKVIERAMAIIPADRYPTAAALGEALLSTQPKPQPAAADTLLGQQGQPGQSRASTRALPNPAAPERAAAGTHLVPPSVSGAPASDTPVANVPTSPVAVEGAALRPPAARKLSKRSTPVVALFGIGGVAALAGIAALIFGPGLIKPQVPAQTLPSATAPVTHSVLPTNSLPQLPSPTASLAPSETPHLAPSASPLPADKATPVETATLMAATEPAAAVTLPPVATPVGGARGQIAYASEQAGQTQVWLMNSDGSNSQQVTHLPDGACQPDWSPDGKRLVFTSPCQGKKELYTGSSLFIINADGTGLTPLVTLPGGDFDPAWSPDGAQIAFTTLRDNNIPHIYRYNLADNSVARLSRVVNREHHPAWSPDGKQIVYSTTRLGQSQIWIMSSDGEKAQEFSTLAGAFDSSPAWAPDGSVVIFSQGNQPILVARQMGNRSTPQFPVSAAVHPVDEARFSPDGWWLAFNLKQDGNADIYMMTQNGANLTRLTTNPGVDFHPAWRP